MRSLDLSGTLFGRLTAISFQETRDGRRYWLCQCKCGQKIDCSVQNLRKGKTRSCGCLYVESRSRAHRTHGETGGGRPTPEYRAWAKMIERCENPKDKFYGDYGGRGISVCERWRVSFENFLSDMGRKPSTVHSLDRERVNGNYEPGNCRWATAVEQARNTRRAKYVDLDGVRVRFADAIEALGIICTPRNYWRIRNRLNSVGSIRVAVEQLLREQKLDGVASKGVPHVL